MIPEVYRDSNLFSPASFPAVVTFANIFFKANSSPAIAVSAEPNQFSTHIVNAFKVFLTRILWRATALVNAAGNLTSFAVSCAIAHKMRFAEILLRVCARLTEASSEFAGPQSLHRSIANEVPLTDHCLATVLRNSYLLLGHTFAEPSRPNAYLMDFAARMATSIAPLREESKDCPLSCFMCSGSYTVGNPLPILRSFKKGACFLTSPARRRC